MKPQIIIFIIIIIIFVVGSIFFRKNIVYIFAKVLS